MAQPLCAPLQDVFRFLRDPIPAGPWALLTDCFPHEGWTTGLPRSAPAPNRWVRPRLSTGGLVGCGEGTTIPALRTTSLCRLKPSASRGTAPSAFDASRCLSTMSMCWPYHRSPAPNRLGASSRDRPSRVGRPLAGRDTLSWRASDRGVAPAARSSRARMQQSRSDRSSYLLRVFRTSDR